MTPATDAKHPLAGADGGAEEFHRAVPHAGRRLPPNRLERLRHRQLSQATASVEFLREILELAQQVTAVERAEDEGHLGEVRILPDANVGALTQIFREYARPVAPVIIENVVTDIDTIVRQVRFTGWSQTQNGDRTVRREVRLTLKKYGLPTTGELFDRAYAYIRENY